MTLERFLQRAGDDVDALVEAWKLNPHPRISAIASQLPASAMFTELFTGKLADVAKKVNALKVRRHPHLSNELERILREPPWSSDASRDVWELVFGLVSDSNDPRFLELAEELPAGWGMRSSQKEWLTEALEAAVEQIAPAAELTKTESDLLQAIERDAFASKPAPKRSTTIDFSAVYANPLDDRPRLVLADALMEQGEERGEFLSLQLRTEKTAAETKREKALLKANAKRWLAPFGPTLGADVQWRRGFPSSGLVKFRDGADVKKYGALPEWATFESLTWSPAKSLEHLPVGGFIGPALRHLRRANGPHTPHLLDGTWALEWLACSFDDADELARLLAHRGLSQLETLHLLNTPFETEWLGAIKSWGAVVELGLPAFRRPWLIHVLAAAEKTPLKRLQWGSGLRFHRESNGELTRLELLHHDDLYGIVGQLQSLPAGLVSSLVAPPSEEWTSGFLGQNLERVIKPAAARPSAAKAAARHLALETVDSLAVADTRAFVSDAETIRVVDTRSLEVIESFPGRGGLLHPQGRDVLFLRDREVVLFDFSSSTERVVFKTRAPNLLARSADGTRAAVDGGGTVVVFDVATGRTVFTCGGEDPSLDATGARMTVKTGGGIELVDLATLSRERVEGVTVRTVFLPDGRLAGRETLGNVIMWRGRGDMLSLTTAADVPWSICGTADGSRIALVQPSITRVFHGRSFKVVSQHAGGRAGLFTPDGRLFVASEEALFSDTPP